MINTDSRGIPLTQYIVEEDGVVSSLAINRVLTEKIESLRYTYAFSGPRYLTESLIGANPFAMAAQNPRLVYQSTLLKISVGVPHEIAITLT